MRNRLGHVPAGDNGGKRLLTTPNTTRLKLVVVPIVKLLDLFRKAKDAPADLTVMKAVMQPQTGEIMFFLSSGTWDPLLVNTKIPAWNPDLSEVLGPVTKERVERWCEQNGYALSKAEDLAQSTDSAGDSNVEDS